MSAPIRFRRATLTVAVAIAATLGIASSASAAPPIRVGTVYSVAPIAIVTPDGGLTGFEPDLVRAAAKAAGARVQFVHYRVFENMLTAAINADVDMAASTLTITPAREQVLQFGSPYVSTNQAIGALKTSPISSLAGLRGKTLGAVEGTTAETTIRRVKGAKVRLFATTLQLVAATQAGTIDAFVGDLIQVSWYTGKTDDLHVAAEIDNGQKGAWAYPRTDAGTATKATMDRGLRIIRKNGTYAKILKRWGLMAP